MGSEEWGDKESLHLLKLFLRHSVSSIEAQHQKLDIFKFFQLGAFVSAKPSSSLILFPMNMYAWFSEIRWDYIRSAYVSISHLVHFVPLLTS